MKKQISLFIFGLLLISSSCDENVFGETFYTMTLKNNTEGLIYFVAYDEFSAVQYPDTALPLTAPHLTKIESNGKFYIHERTPWQELIKKLSVDTLSIFFFADSIYEDSSWSAISNQYLILKRYDLSIEDLERINFKVPYPPDETMEGIKMYSPE